MLAGPGQTVVHSAGLPVPPAVHCSSLQHRAASCLCGARLVSRVVGGTGDLSLQLWETAVGGADAA